MSADLSLGAFHGTRSKTGTNRSSTTPALTPQHDELDVSVSRPTARQLFKVHKPPSTPQSILKRAGQNGDKKRVNISDNTEYRLISSPDSRPSTPEGDNITSSNSKDLDSKPEADQMSAASRPKLTLKFSSINVKSEDQEAAPLSAAPPSATPSVKLTLKTPRPAPDVKTPSASKTKTKKANGATPGSSSKKRKQNETAGDSSEDELIHGKQTKRFRLSHNGMPPPSSVPLSAVTPTLKIKHKGKLPKRLPGVGYDSELSDCEKDPTISEAFILRMLPGPDCDYMRNAVEKGLIGLPRKEGGADVQLRFFDHRGRRGTVIIQGRAYATSLVDLPCIVEGMKSWDKKGWVKSADISQMLLVLGRVATDDEAQNFPLPSDIDSKTFQYAHGITPPMQWVRKRRFARTKRTSLSAIEAVERKVDQLLADDAAAELGSVKWEVMDYDQYTREQYEQERSQQQSYDESMDGYDEDDDAEGEAEDDDYFGQGGIAGHAPAEYDAQGEEMDEDEVARELEAHLMDSDEDEDDTAVPQINTNGTATHAASAIPSNLENDSLAITSTSASPSAGATGTPADPMTPSALATSEAASDDESEEDDESDGGSLAGASDEEAAAALQEQREKVAELEESIKAEEEKFKGIQNPILRKKIQSQILKLRTDLEVARRGAGMEDEDGEEDEDGD